MGKVKRGRSGAASADASAASPITTGKNSMFATRTGRVDLLKAIGKYHGIIVGKQHTKEKLQQLN